MDFFGAQLIAHGAEIFAALLAALRFTGIFLEETTLKLKSWRTVFFIIAGGTLFGLSTYVTFRILVYSFLLETTIAYDVKSASTLASQIDPTIPAWSPEIRLTDYYRAITCLTKFHHPTISFWFVDDVWRRGILACVILGMLLSLTIWWIYRPDKNKK